jgi:predicted DNA binding protein
MGMIEAVLAVKAPDWMDDLERKYDAKISVLGCLPFPGGGVKDLVEIRVSEDKLDDAVEDLRRSPQFKDVDVSQTSKDRVLASIHTDSCAVCSVLAASECFLISASTRDGGIYWTLLASGKKPIRKLMRAMKGKGYDVRIIKMAEVKGREALTTRQEEIIRVAYEKGYFDYPKKISLRQLARLFGVSISTISEVLRTGQKKIIRAHLSEIRETR